MTGQDVLKDFQNRAGLGYSVFIDKIKLNRVLKRALYDVTKNKNKELTQKQFDDLKYQISTEKVIDVRSNRFYTSPIVISGIGFLGNVAQVTTATEHNLLSGDVIILQAIQGVATSPDINSSFTVVGVPSSKMFEFPVASVGASVYVASTGYITHDRMLTDYMHLYALKCKALKRLDNQVEKITQGGVISLVKRCNLRNGDLVQIKDYTPLAAVSGLWYVKYITDKKIRLYEDESLQTSFPIGLSATGIGGVISQVFYNYASPITSDQKIGNFVKGDADNAKYETADGMIKLYPANVLFSSVTVDYFAKPKIEIDTNDNVIDLLLYYPFSLMDKIINDAVKKYTTGAHDPVLEASTTREIQTSS